MNDMPEEPEEGSMIYMQLPPEIREYFAHQRMHAEENGHTALRFLESLDAEQLRSFRGIITGVGSIPDSIPYYMGLVGGLLLKKFDICIACGKNHDEAISEMTGDGPKTEPFDRTQYSIDLENYAVELADGVSFLDNGFDPAKAEVFCTGPCSQSGGERGNWTNLEQRMERKADIGGCDFCANIQKWG